MSKKVTVHGNPDDLTIGRLASLAEDIGEVHIDTPDGHVVITHQFTWSPDDA